MICFLKNNQHDASFYCCFLTAVEPFGSDFCSNTGFCGGTDANGSFKHPGCLFSDPGCVRLFVGWIFHLRQKSKNCLMHENIPINFKSSS